jgi:hypothetical protein
MHRNGGSSTRGASPTGVGARLKCHWRCKVEMTPRWGRGSGGGRARSLCGAPRATGARCTATRNRDFSTERASARSARRTAQLIKSRWIVGHRRQDVANPPRQLRQHRAAHVPSRADPVPRGCSAAAGVVDRRACGLGDTTPATRARTPVLRPAACSRRSRRAPRCGFCRTPGTAARYLRAGPQSARPGSSPPRPSCPPARARTASGPTGASSGRSAG